MNGARRVLVTGASGFIGRHVVPWLVSRGYEVHIVGRRPPLEETPAGIVEHAVDLLAGGDVARVMAAVRPSHLLHLAWNATPGKFWTAIDNLDWVAASLRLYRSFAENGGQRAVFAGTCAEYDWGQDWLDEADTPLKPRTLYGTAKNTLRSLLAAADEQTGVSTAWGRIFFLYGPHEASSRLVPDVMVSLLQQRSPLCTEGWQERDFMHVDDVARAFAILLDSDRRGPVNIASGVCLPVRSVVATIGELAGRPDLLQFGSRPMPAGEPPRLAANTHILTEQLGFAPRYSLATGLAATLDWWRDHLPTGISPL